LQAVGICFHDDSALERPFSIVGTYIGLAIGGGSGPEGSLLTFVVALAALVLMVRRVRSQA